MPQHHPGTFFAKNNVDLTDAPWALTTHLLSVNHDQLLRTTRHPFLARAANGTLPKPLVAQWLADDLQYLKVYKGISEHTLAIVRRIQPEMSVSNPEDMETRLIAWLNSAIQNGNREERFFQEVAEIYKIDINITQTTKNEGLRRYEALFNTFIANERNAFLPWLEGAVLLWTMEKVYYEAWSWARGQDAQSSPRNFDNDQDGGAMRREFIPNWSNRDFLMFVEQLERILNEVVSTAVKGDDNLWNQVKIRTDAVYAAVLDAEEAFWPNVDGTSALQEAVVGDNASGRELDGSTLGSVDRKKVSTENTHMRDLTIEARAHGSVSHDILHWPKRVRMGRAS
ncbi:hypothetical protein GQ44DRAFT_749634 [Phaeosphaeriaceae sp. PMI808]|nr:hypothetical protein GQ44DRAFT_749634 [Phaeosphaeriaceae sp. PMI808]